MEAKTFSQNELKVIADFFANPLIGKNNLLTGEKPCVERGTIYFKESALFAHLQDKALFTAVFNLLLKRLGARRSVYWLSPPAGGDQCMVRAILIQARNVPPVADWPVETIKPTAPKPTAPGKSRQNQLINAYFSLASENRNDVFRAKPWLDRSTGTIYFIRNGLREFITPIYKYNNEIGGQLIRILKELKRRGAEKTEIEVNHERIHVYKINHDSVIREEK